MNQVWENSIRKFRRIEFSPQTLQTLQTIQKQTGAKPTIGSYNASGVKIYSATNSMPRFNYILIIFKYI
jgi:hypothetical protein